MLNFQVILTTLCAAFTAFLYYRGIRPIGEHFGGAWIPALLSLHTIGILNLLWLPWIHWRSEGKSTSAEVALEKGAHLWMGIFSLLFFTLVLREIVNLGWKLISIRPENFGANSAALSLIAGFALFLLGVWNASRGPRVVPVTLTHPNYEGSEPLKIVQVSDLHIGTHIRRAYVENVVRQVNALHPDLVVFTGDIADGDAETYDADLTPLRDLHAPFGKFYCTGNHEFYWDEDAWKKKFAGVGLTVLDNAHTSVRVHGTEILVAGINDIRPNYALALADARADRFNLLLAHRPAHVMQAKKFPVHLQLSGHTHAGQFLPWTLIIRLVERFPRGRYLLGDLILYVNVGTGFWGPPLRLGSRSEITAIELRGVDAHRVKMGSLADERSDESAAL